MTQRRQHNPESSLWWRDSNQPASGKPGAVHYWGRHFWARGYFCTTSGNVTDEIILQHIEQHADKPTGVSR